MKKQKNHSGIWIMIVAGIALEAISCIMYFTSRAAIRMEAEQRAKTELRKAELEIELHTIEMETAAKTLALLVEKHINCADSVFLATDLAVRTLRTPTSLAVAFVPDENDYDENIRKEGMSVRKHYTTQQEAEAQGAATIITSIGKRMPLNYEIILKL